MLLILTMLGFCLRSLVRAWRSSVPRAHEEPYVALTRVAHRENAMMEHAPIITALRAFGRTMQQVWKGAVQAAPPNCGLAD